MKTKIFLLVLIIFTFTGSAKAQDNNYPQYDTAAPELLDVQRVINATLPDIETMLKQKGTFKPFATVILANDSIADIAVSDPTKTYTADDLKEELSIGALKGEYKVVVIFSAETVAPPGTEQSSKAIAVFAEHTNDDFAYLFYYPYTIGARKEVKFGESFGDFAPQVMFKP
jgi:hypothetical protein